MVTTILPDDFRSGTDMPGGKRLGNSNPKKLSDFLLEVSQKVNESQDEPQRFDLPLSKGRRCFISESLSM